MGKGRSTNPNAQLAQCPKCKLTMTKDNFVRRHQATCKGFVVLKDSTCPFCKIQIGRTNLAKHIRIYHSQDKKDIQVKKGIENASVKVLRAAVQFQKKIQNQDLIWASMKQVCLSIPQNQKLFFVGFDKVYQQYPVPKFAILNQMKKRQIFPRGTPISADHLLQYDILRIADREQYGVRKTLKMYAEQVNEWNKSIQDTLKKIPINGMEIDCGQGLQHLKYHLQRQTYFTQRLQEPREAFQFYKKGQYYWVMRRIMAGYPLYIQHYKSQYCQDVLLQVEQLKRKVDEARIKQIEIAQGQSQSYDQQGRVPIQAVRQLELHDILTLMGDAILERPLPSRYGSLRESSKQEQREHLVKIPELVLKQMGLSCPLEIRNFEMRVIEIFNRKSFKLSFDEILKIISKRYGHPLKIKRNQDQDQLDEIISQCKQFFNHINLKKKGDKINFYKQLLEFESKGMPELSKNEIIAILAARDTAQKLKKHLEEIAKSDKVPLSYAKRGRKIRQSRRRLRQSMGLSRRAYSGIKKLILRKRIQP